MGQANQNFHYSYVCGQAIDPGYSHFDAAGSTCPKFDKHDIELVHNDEVKKAQEATLAKVRAEKPDIHNDDLSIKVSEAVQNAENESLAQKARHRHVGAQRHRLEIVQAQAQAQHLLQRLQHKEGLGKQAIPVLPGRERPGQYRIGDFQGQAFQHQAGQSVPNLPADPFNPHWQGQRNAFANLVGQFGPAPFALAGAEMFQPMQAPVAPNYHAFQAARALPPMPALGLPAINPTNPQGYHRHRPVFDDEALRQRIQDDWRALGRPAFEFEDLINPDYPNAPGVNAQDPNAGLQYLAATARQHEEEIHGAAEFDNTLVDTLHPGPKLENDVREQPPRRMSRQASPQIHNGVKQNQRENEVVNNAHHPIVLDDSPRPVKNTTASRNLLPGQRHKDLIDLT